jgi:hypothetical protein
MMHNGWETALAILLSSSLMGSVIGVVLKVYLERRLQSRFDHLLLETKHRYELEIAALSAQLEGSKKLRERFAEERFDACRALANHIYRLRNVVRTLTKLEAENDSNLEEEFSALASELPNLLYKHRIALDEELFTNLHAFKEKILAIQLALRFSRSDHPDRAQFLKAAQDAYALIDQSYNLLVAALRVRVDPEIGPGDGGNKPRPGNPVGRLRK